jgi:hypothetical protein
MTSGFWRDHALNTFQSSCAGLTRASITFAKSLFEDGLPGLRRAEAASAAQAGQARQ